MASASAGGPALAAVSPNSVRERLARVVRELENLRFDYLHASIGLPLPSVRQLTALARLRPSSLPLDPQPAALPSLTPGGRNSSNAAINPRVGPLPTWTIHQTRAFGQVFLDRMKEAARSQALPLDAYTLTSAAAKRATAAGQEAATRLDPCSYQEAVADFNSGRRSLSEIASNLHQRQQIQQPGSAPVKEETVLRWLVEAEALGLVVAWEQLGVSQPLLEVVDVSVQAARALEAGLGGEDPLTVGFPLQCLRQLLPDYGDADVLAALCLLRHQQQHQKRVLTAPKTTSGTVMPPAARSPLAPLAHPPLKEARAAAGATPLKAAVMAVLQARDGAGEGVTIGDCMRALYSSSSSLLGEAATVAAVEAAFVGLEESFLVYRAGGGFKLL